MKKTLYILACFLFSLGTVLAQKSDNATNHSVRLVYSECTQNSKQELRDLLKNDKVAIKEAYNKYYRFCKEGKIILSTKEFAPIKQRIETFDSSNGNQNSEASMYAKNARKKYVLVTDLIEK
tara:strand:- start:298 stop:663 length:366 start_codon:yes stop_codon:yes gene_type:complete